MKITELPRHAFDVMIAFTVFSRNVSPARISAGTCEKSHGSSGCRTAAVHVVALVGADPGVIRHSVVRQIGGKLAEVHDVRHARCIVAILLEDFETDRADSRTPSDVWTQCEKKSDAILDRSHRLSRVISLWIFGCFEIARRTSAKNYHPDSRGCRPTHIRRRNLIH